MKLNLKEMKMLQLKKHRVSVLTDNEVALISGGQQSASELCHSEGCESNVCISSDCVSYVCWSDGCDSIGCASEGGNCGNTDNCEPFSADCPTN